MKYLLKPINITDLALDLAIIHSKAGVISSACMLFFACTLFFYRNNLAIDAIIVASGLFTFYCLSVIFVAVCTCLYESIKDEVQP